MREHLGLERDEDLAAYFTKKRTEHGGSYTRSMTLTQSGLANWKGAERRGVPPDVMFEFAEFEGVTVEWVAFGEGPKYREQAYTQAERRGNLDLRSLRLLQDIQGEPVMVRALEAVLTGPRELRKIFVALPRLSATQAEAVSKVVEAYVP